MKKILFIVGAVLLVSAIASADLAVYSQDFEGLSQADPAALSNDGWVIYANVFGLDWNYWYGYGTFPAPNNAGGFSGIDIGQGGPTQGAQQLVVYSDYNNGQHGFAIIEANVFKEYVVGAADVGSTWLFEFDVKLGNLQAPSTAMAFIKTLDPSNGWALTNFLQFPTHTMPAAWGTGSLSITIDPSLVGQILQIGFSNIASQWASSGVFYDNINFALAPVTVQVDIKPGTCPNSMAAKGRGTLTVAIVGGPGLDLTTIDLESITLGGAPVVRSRYEDVSSIVGGDGCPGGPDGTDDLVLKFSRSDIVAGLGAVSHGDAIVLDLKGSLLTTGGDVVGSDVIVIVGKADPSQRPNPK